MYRCFCYYYSTHTVLPDNFAAIDDEFISFDTGDTRQCNNINLTPNDECELQSDYVFNATLEVLTGAGNITVEPRNAQVIINDDLETKCGMYII